MGASKTEFTNMREQEFMINATFKVKGKDINTIENYLLDQTNLINYETMQNNDALYKTDQTFRKMLKAHKQSKIDIQEYAKKKQITQNNIKHQ